MPSCNLYLLGTPRIEIEEKPKTISRRKTMALLAYLAMTNKPHNRDFLATLFWPDYDQTGARANLRRDLSRLKNALGGELFHIDRSQVSMNPDGDWQLDVRQFVDHLNLVRTHDHFPQHACPQCLAACTEAIALYTADFMVGFSLPDCADFDEWQFFQADSLRQSLAELLQRLLQWHSSQGEFERALEYGRRWLALDTLHEEAHQQLMKLYAWLGQQSAAMRQYDECVRILDEELGVEPEPETQELYELIRTRQLEPPEIEKVTDMALFVPEPPPPAERYKVLNKLDAGGHGDVFLGEDQTTGQKVVIKRIKPDLIDRDSAILTRFQREGDILRQLNHPNIVRMLDMYEHDGEQHLVMEYVAGGSLRQKMEANKAPLPIEDALKIALELADALSRAHHLGVIHRDIKPENVLIAEDGSVRLTDFGMARLENVDVRLTQTGVLIGSPAYMSPESLQGAKVDGRGDIWSFGVLLYELLVGAPPFDSDQLTTTIVQILNDPTPDLKQVRATVPDMLADLVQHMLIKQPAQRIGSMRQVAAVLETIQNGRIDAQTGNITPLSTPIHTPTPIKTPLPFVSKIPNNLPRNPAPFVGRVEESRQIQRLLVEEQSCRLLTLFGPSGVGKTRLAIEASTQLLPHFPDGIFFVSLEAILRTDLIAQTLAETLPMQFSGAATPKAQLLHFLRPKQMLLLVDNFDHLLDGSSILAEILRLAPGIKLLVTSHDRLGLQEEWSLEIGHMTFPQADETLSETQLVSFSAPQLFLQRARRADASFALNAEKVASVVRICRLLEGMPLGLELAAPWVRSTSCVEIADQLAQELGDDHQPQSNSSVPEFSVRSIFAKTWHSLSAEQQRVLSCLSVFRAGCEREAAEVVAQTSLPVLVRLVDQALVQQDGNGRFTLHPFIHQLATEKLQEDTQAYEATLDAHSYYYLTFLAERAPKLKGEKQERELERISIELDNIRNAWLRGIANQAWQNILDAVETVWLFSEFRGFFHEGEAGYRLALEGLARVAEPDELGVTLSAYLQAGHGILMARRGWVVEGIPKIEAGLEILEAQENPDEQKIAIVEMWLATALLLQSEFEVAMDHIQNAMNTIADTDDYWMRANCLRLLGVISLNEGDLATAEKLLDDCLTLCRRIGEQRIQTYARASLGVIAMMRGDYGRSQQWFNEAIELSRQLGDRLSRVELLRDQGVLAIQQGQYAQAVDLLARSKQISTEIGRPIAGKITCAQGVIHYRQGDTVGAKALFQNGMAAAKAMGNHAGVAECLQQLALLTYEEGMPDHAEQLLQDAYAIWQEMGNEPWMAAVDCSLGHVITGSDTTRRHEARTIFQYALETALAYDLAPLGLDAATGLAALLMQDGDVETAVSPLFLALKHPASTIVTKNSAKRLIELLPAELIAAQQKNPTLTDWQTLCKKLIQRKKQATTPTVTELGNLPVDSSPFVGRDQEVAEIKSSFVQDQAHLVTIVGPGGIGKTRLSVAVANTLTAYFPHGVWFVSLAPLESAEQLLAAVAEALNFHLTPSDDPGQQLIDYLQDKKLLLVFDNFEHLLPNTQFVARILANCTDVQLLVTSRQRLNLGEEVVYALAGMSFPSFTEHVSEDVTRYGAVELFLLQVQVMQPHYQLRAEDQPAILKICQLVQGMPLALVLAAGWADMLSFAEIAEEIMASLDFLESERRDLPQRQRSVRAVFDGSWQQLADDAKLVFAHLSVFRGGFTRQAAQAVAGANLRALRRLINNSFIVVNENGRYEIHELLRQYGEEHLQTMGQYDNLRNTHSGYFLSLLADLEDDIKGKRQVEAIGEIEVDFENIVSAWNWAARRGDFGCIGAAMETMHLFCDMLSRYQEGVEIFKVALEHCPSELGEESGLIHARLQLRYAFLQVFFPTNWEQALATLKTSMVTLQMYEDAFEIALNHLAQATYVYTTVQTPESSKHHFEEANILFDELGDDFYQGRTLVGMSYCYAAVGDLEGSHRLTEEGIALAKRCGNKADLAYALNNLAEHALGMGEYAVAKKQFTEAVESADFVDNYVLRSYSSVLLGFVVWLEGDLEEAQRLMRVGLRLAENINHSIALAFAEASICLWAATVGENQSAKHWAQSSYDNPANNTIGLVMAQWGLALVACNERDWATGQVAFAQMFKEAQMVNYPAPLYWLLPMLAVWVAEQGDLEEAATLLALAQHHPLNSVGWMAHWQPIQLLQKQLEAELGSDVYEQVLQKGRDLVAEVDAETAVTMIQSMLQGDS